MTARLLKESRSVFPIVAAGMVALIACVLLGDGWSRVASATTVLCLLAAVIGISSMGIELLHGMHLSLFTQPVPREESWRDKTLVQGLALIALAAVYSWVVSGINMDERAWWASRVPDRLSLAAAATLFAFGCGSFFVLAIRHVQGAFWFLIGSAFLLFTGIEALWPMEYMDWQGPGMVLIAGLLAFAGLALSRRQYLAFQNYSALDGMVALSGGKTEQVRTSAFQLRGVTGTLVVKELLLQWINLAVFLTAFAIGVAWGCFYSWGEWALMKDFVCLCLPLFIGAAAISEERRLGVHAWHFTMPQTRLRQWLTKVLVCQILALVVGVGLYAGSAWAKPLLLGHGLIAGVSVPAYAGYVVWAVALGMFASSLSRHYVQAAAVICFLLLIGVVLDQVGVYWLVGQYGNIASRNLFRVIVIPVLLVFFLHQAYRNGASALPPSILVTRSSIKLTACLAIVLLLTAFGYHRTWERFESQAIGTGRISTAAARQFLHEFNAGVTVDARGRLWKNEWKIDWRKMGLSGGPAMPVFSQVGTDADWDRVIPSGRHRHGYGVLKTNGSLWIAAGPRYEGSKKEEYHQITGVLNSNLTLATPGFRWRDVSWTYYHWVGIRDDGTLWVWGSNRNVGLGHTNRTDFATAPIQVGNDKDWLRITKNTWRGNYAIKEDGTAWHWAFFEGTRANPIYVAEPRPAEPFIGLELENLRRMGSSLIAKTRSGESLLFTRREINENSRWFELSVPVPGKEGLYRLKPTVDWDEFHGYPIYKYPDGSLWYHHASNRVPMGARRWRLDDSSDWIAKNDMWWNHFLGIKRDGSLWWWPGTYFHHRQNKTFYEGQNLTFALTGFFPRRHRPVKIGMLDPKLWQ